MTTTPLIVWIEIADLAGFAAPALPFNGHIDVFHMNLLSQRTRVTGWQWSALVPREAGRSFRIQYLFFK
jgi:hypothetical protein